MRRLCIAVIFCVSGILVSIGVVWTLMEQPGSDVMSIDATQDRPRPVGFAKYADLWNASGATQTVSADPGRVEKLWLEAVRSSHTADSPLRAQLRNEAKANTAVLNTLLQKFEREQDPNLRELLKSILFGIQQPEMLPFAVKLAESSNPLLKIEGFDLLSQLSGGERQLRQAAMKTLAAEDDPVVLRHVIMALDPKASTPLEVAEVTKKLHQLTQHVDIGVRKQSIELLSRWDRTANMESLLEKSLADPTVRFAAINVLYDSQHRSENIKLALLNIVRGDEELTRNYALDVLAKFDLTNQEREQIRAGLQTR